MLLQQSIEPVPNVYTCITYFSMHWSMLFIPQFQVNFRIQYQIVNEQNNRPKSEHMIMFYGPFNLLMFR